MASRMRREDYREAMMKVAQCAGEGIPISDVLASYPDLFPSHVVGLVRAGEVGGFLPEACTAVAQQAEASHKFRRSLWFVWAVAINFILVPPFAYLFYRALPRGYELIESSGASDPAGGIQQMAKAFSQLFWWPIAPVAAVIYLITWGVYAWLNSRPMTLKRHGLSLHTPVLGGRAKNEGLSLFSWVLSKVAQSGASPHRSWDIGMEAVPNLALKEKLRTAAARLHSGERLSTAFYETKLFPDEYAPMVATGEMTGDVPGMLQRLSEMSRQEFDVSTTKSKAAAWVMSSVTIAITMGIIALAIILTLYYALPNTVLKGMDTP
jgi:type II secretory pathway component PulF